MNRFKKNKVDISLEEGQQGLAFLYCFNSISINYYLHDSWGGIYCLPQTGRKKPKTVAVKIGAF